MTHQKLVTLDAWLALGEDEVLYVELSEAFTTTGGGRTTAVQVRATRAPLSLAHGKARDIVRFAWERPENCLTVYWTTSRAARERNLGGADGETGIGLWERASRGDDAALETVRLYLRGRGGWPSDLADALRDQPTDELRNTLLRRLRWDLDRLPLRNQEAAVKLALMERLKSRSQAAANLASMLMPELLQQIERRARETSPEDRAMDRFDLEEAIETGIDRTRNVTAFDSPVASSSRPIPSLNLLYPDSLKKREWGCAEAEIGFRLGA